MSYTIEDMRDSEWDWRDEVEREARHDYYNQDFDDERPTAAEIEANSRRLPLNDEARRGIADALAPTQLLGDDLPF